MIGAHSLVLQDIPDSAVVVGNPARIVSMDGAEKQNITYENSICYTLFW